LDAVALDATEQLLAGRHADGFAATVHAEAPDLVQGEHARAQRAAPPLTRFDGLTGAPAPHHALGNGQTPVSASQLETLAACPFRYFLKYVLDVAPPDRPEDEPDRWLDPMQFGQLVHELYHTFMQRHGGQVQSRDDHRNALMALVDETIEAYRARIPVRREAAFRADRRRIKRAARVFLAAEAQRSDAEPVAFEVSFGQGVAFGSHRAAPVAITLTEDVRLQLRGRIDRVDRLPGGDYVIWDYKTGSMRAYDAQDLSAGGQRLQWALYAYAFEAMLHDAGRDGAVARSGYFFANERAFGQRLSAPPPDREGLGAQLRPLLDLALHGAFPHVQKRRDACRFCDYRRLCAEESKTARDVPAVTEEMADHPISEILARWMGDT
jgi:ATP-dependent helicase/nuclease subunit B